MERTQKVNNSNFYAKMADNGSRRRLKTMSTSSTEGSEIMEGNRDLFKEFSSSMPTLLPWDRFSQWIHSLCVVTFDLEIGQAMELIYPGHMKLSDRERNNICYLSFPDSNSGCMGDTQFHFRIRQSTLRRSSVPALAQYDRNCLTTLQTGKHYFFGYVYFRQVKDRSLRRGYFQKSVVLLTRLPLVNLFYKLIGIIAPDYFANGEPSIEAACHDIDQWPAPEPGIFLSLPLMGSVFQIRIASKLDKIGSNQPAQTLAESSSVAVSYVLPTLHEPDIFRYLWPVLSHVHLLWELILLGEPLVVMASSPSISSQMVQALVSIIWPLRFCADYRPFFTIHDSEFKEYTSKTQQPPSVILGVTNPFFAKTLQHWPHIIRLGDTPTSAILSPVSQKQKIRKAGSLKTLDCKPGVYTRYQPFLQKDKSVLKKLLKGVQNRRPREVQNAILRRHLFEMTQSFTIPLERYMASLMPLQRNISPHKATPTPNPFNPDDFFRMLETSGPKLTTGIKGDWTGLYRRFFKSPNFLGWYEGRHLEVSHKLQALHLEALSDSNLVEWIQNKKEVEIVDLILKIRKKLEVAELEHLPVRQITVLNLQESICNIIRTLPDDLQTVLMSN